MPPDAENREWREWELALTREQRRLSPETPFVRCVPKNPQEKEAVTDPEFRRRLDEVLVEWRRRSEEPAVDEFRREMLRRWGHPFDPEE